MSVNQTIIRLTVAELKREKDFFILNHGDIDSNNKERWENLLKSQLFEQVKIASELDLLSDEELGATVRELVRIFNDNGI